jgi:hypothetical protein
MQPAAESYALGRVETRGAGLVVVQKVSQNPSVCELRSGYRNTYAVMRHKRPTKSSHREDETTSFDKSWPGWDSGRRNHSCRSWRAEVNAGRQFT